MCVLVKTAALEDGCKVKDICYLSVKHGGAGDYTSWGVCESHWALLCCDVNYFSDRDGGTASVRVDDDCFDLLAVG